MGARERRGTASERFALGPDPAPIRIGVSSCLLGRAVRWDGAHKRDDLVTDELGPFVEWVPVCPEVELGMGVPRDAIRLVDRDGALRLVAERSGEDHTAAMRAWAKRRLRELAALELCGYVLKAGSPSCGMEGVPVWSARGMSERRGRGAFAAALLDSCEALPVEEATRLHDPRLRENWIERVFAYRRLRSLFGRAWTLRDLVAFHAGHELQLLAHAPARGAALGRLVARGRAKRRGALRAAYERGFMDALRQIATPRRHAHALRRALGRLRARLDVGDRRALRRAIDDYAAGLLPLVVPIALIRHHVARLGVDELGAQFYLEPDPKELMLRNRA